MQVVSLLEAQNNLQNIFDSVCNDNDEVIINNNGNDNVVVIPFSQYSAMKETQYLLSNPNNAKRLMESIQELKAGKTTQKESHLVV